MALDVAENRRPATPPKPGFIYGDRLNYNRHCYYNPDTRHILIPEPDPVGGETPEMAIDPIPTTDEPYVSTMPEIPNK